MASYHPHFYPPSPSDSSSSASDNHCNSTQYNPCPTSRPPLPRSSTKPISHPYARLYAKEGEVKRRRIWNHSLEKAIFNPDEISNIGAPNRRKIYIASLEAHIDDLHSQLESLGFMPVAPGEIEQYKGLNSKTAKSIVAGLQYDASTSKLKLLELERAARLLQFGFSLESCDQSMPEPATTTDCNSLPSLSY